MGDEQIICDRNDHVVRSAMLQLSEAFVLRIDLSKKSQEGRLCIVWYVFRHVRDHELPNDSAAVSAELANRHQVRQQAGFRCHLILFFI